MTGPRLLVVTGAGASDVAALVVAIVGRAGLEGDVVVRACAPDALPADRPHAHAVVAETAAEVTHATGRQVSVTLGPPGHDQLGVVRQQGGPPLLVDRAFAPGAPASADALIGLDELPGVIEARHLSRVLVAAALALAVGVDVDGLREALAQRNISVDGATETFP